MAGMYRISLELTLPNFRSPWDRPTISLPSTFAPLLPFPFPYPFFSLLLIYYVLALWPSIFYCLFFPYHLCIKIIIWQSSEFQLCQEFRAEILFCSTCAGSYYEYRRANGFKPLSSSQPERCDDKEELEFSRSPVCQTLCARMASVKGYQEGHLLFQQLEFDFLYYHGDQCIWQCGWLSRKARASLSCHLPSW